MRDNGENRREPTRTGENGREQASASVLASSRLFSSVLAVFGMPDYPAYCRHLLARHPDQPVLSEREFFDQFLRARYGDGPTRCC